ncbi:MAG: 2Fe-2S iron-sulfur cluster-binding protein [Alphaproteobacteria bacterium]
MTKITFIDAAGVERVVEVAEDLTVMEAAVKNNVPGIDADCGGACACATCHVYVDESQLGKLGDKTDMETSMLDFADSVQPTSRLACQVRVVDGLRVTTPEQQF